MIMRLLVTIEAKDEYENPATGRWGPGELPAAPAARNAVADRIQDVLRDVTKHDETIGWRVTRVQRAV